MNENAVVCVKCGVMAGTGVSYCPHCGERTDHQAIICTKCGVEFKRYLQYHNIGQIGQQKSKIAAGLLGIFLGCLGVHNFYLGYTAKAVAQLLITLLSFGVFSFIPAIWGLVEGIMILTGSINVDGKGVQLKD